MTMTKRELSFAARIGLAEAGLLTQSDVEDLIREAVAQHRVMYLPKPLAAYAQEMMLRGTLKKPES